MRKILLLILCLSLAASCLVLTSCGGDTDCTEHVDTDKNGKCDNCGAEVEKEPCDEHIDADGDFLCDECGAAVLPKGPEQVDVVITVKDDEGDVLAGVSVILAHGEDDKYNTTTAASDVNGKITAKIYTGTYGVYYDYDTDTLGYYLSDTTSVTVSGDTTSIELFLIDNNPNGTPEKPYIISAGENTFTIPAGTSYSYIIYRAVNLYFGATGATGIKVNYGENEYTADTDGGISFALLGSDTNSAETLTMANTTDADITFSVEINSAPGTYGNPIVVENVGAAITTAPIASGSTVYYTYTATASGVFSITLGTDGAYVSMANGTTYESVNSTEDAVDGTITLEVNEGDVIMIDLSIKTGDAREITFTPALLIPQAW